MRYFALALIGTIFLSGCQGSEGIVSKQSNPSNQTEVSKKFSQVTINEETNNPNIGISSYTLITDNVQAHRADAKAIMQVKINFPLAMQTKDEALFNRILAKDFTFRGEDEFYGREDYIRDRVGNNEVVASAQYENLVLQFIAHNIALLTYRNTIKIKDADGKPQTLNMSWADTYVKEDGDWKIGVVHLIDLRAEKE
jgi:ketosteroid isomerase-like protein